MLRCDLIIRIINVLHVHFSCISCRFRKDAALLVISIVSNNQEIPGDVAGLTRLRRLDVSYNLIKTVDVCLLEQLGDRLRYFNVRENPFHCDDDCSLQAPLRRVYFRLVKRWVVERGAARRRDPFQKDRRPLTTSPFVPGKCRTPAKLLGASIIDWKSCRRDGARARLVSPARCNDIPS